MYGEVCLIFKMFINGLNMVLLLWSRVKKKTVHGMCRIITITLTAIRVPVNIQLVDKSKASCNSIQSPTTLLNSNWYLYRNTTTLRPAANHSPWNGISHITFNQTTGTYTSEDISQTRENKYICPILTKTGSQTS